MNAATLTELEIRFVELAPMRVVAVRAVSASPEREAWRILRTWAEPRGWLDDLAAHPIFGFNNPAPQPGCAAYGYELWIRGHLDTDIESEFETKDFGGGWYAVMRCRLLHDPHGRIDEVWRRLWDAVQASGRYHWRREQELERPIDPHARPDDMLLDLYLPVEPLEPA